MVASTQILSRISRSWIAINLNNPGIKTPKTRKSITVPWAFDFEYEKSSIGDGHFLG